MFDGCCWVVGLILGDGGVGVYSFCVSYRFIFVFILEVGEVLRVGRGSRVLLGFCVME